MVKDIGDKYALLAVADRTGDTAVVAVDAIGHVSRKFIQVGNRLTGLLEHLIPIGDAPGHQFLDGLFATSRFLSSRNSAQVVNQGLTLRCVGL